VERRDHEAADGGRERVLDVLRAVWERGRGDVLRRVTTVEDAVAALLERRLDEAAREAAQRDAHKLAGSLGTFGLERGSELARELEEAFAGGPAFAEVPHLATLARELREEVERTAPAARRDGGASAGGAVDGQPDADATIEGDGGASVRRAGLLVVSSDDYAAERWIGEAAIRGLAADRCAGPEALRSALAAGVPEVALVDLGAGGSAVALLAELGEVPAIVLAEDDGLPARLEALRGGAAGLLRRGLPPARVLDAVERLLRASDDPVRAVVAAGGGPSEHALAEALRAGGIDVREAGGGGAALWAALHEGAVDLLVLGAGGGGSPAEVCRALRADPRWTSMPIAVLEPDPAPERLGGLRAAGADDCLRIPLEPGAVERLRALVRAARDRAALGDRDPVTGLPGAARATRELARLFALAGRLDLPVSLALVELDGAASGAPREQLLIRLGDLLERRLRPHDVIGRTAGGGFVVGVAGLDAPAARRRLEEVQRAFAGSHAEGPGPLGFSAGVAARGEAGRDVGQVLRSAEQALARAVGEGGGRVLAAGTGEAERDSVDVVVVEDDGPLADLLLHSLETAGHQARWLADGAQAVASLCGEQPKLAARVVLLDIDLPAVSGLTVLRRLARDGVLAGTRVIVLTARAGEHEVVEALELGAFDHVAKPFSLPVLMRRLQRAIET
jgi:DNA-binding response OmpR family regulator/HPt (histidine-containing phosphotransfer) domain-containing protein